MAPRKDASLPAPSPSQTQQDASSEGIEDVELPKLLVTQLAKSALPHDAKLEDDTITALVKGSTVFINYLTAAAQEIAASRAHKTISGADVLKALEVLDFSEFVPAFQGELEVFRQGTKTEKGKSRVILEVKGKGKEKAPPSNLSKSTTIPPPETTPSAQGKRAEGESGAKVVNGDAVPPADVEMRDAQADESQAKATKPITLPIE